MNARASAILALIVMMAACTASETASGGGDRWAGTMEERDGVVYVSNPAEGLWDHREQFPVRWELEETFGVETGADEAILGRIGDFTVDATGGVYVYDSQRHRLVAFDPQGEVRWAAGQQGQGPRDFDDVAGLVWDGDAAILVANLRSARLDRWTTSGAHGGSYLLEGVVGSRADPVGVLASDRIVFSEHPQGQITPLIRIVGLSDVAERVAEIAPDLYPELQLSPPLGCIGAVVRNARPGMASATHCGTPLRVVGGGILVGNDLEYVLRRYDAEGALQGVVTRSVEYMVPPGTATLPQGLTVYAFYSVLSAPLEIPSGHWIVSSEWLAEMEDPGEAVRDTIENDVAPDNPAQSGLDFFDPAGRYLGTLHRDDQHLLEVGRLELVGPDGKLYTVVEDPFPQVRRFRVTVVG